MMSETVSDIHREERNKHGNFDLESKAIDATEQDYSCAVLANPLGI